MNESEAAIKAISDAGELALDVLGVPHGRDRQGQTFDAQTDLGPMQSVPVVYWHGFDERSEPVVETIGWAAKGRRDASGQWYRVVLDKAKGIAAKIYDDAVKGMVRASSDAIAHLVRPTGILGRPGYVSSWPVAALSLMDAKTYETAINPRAIAMPAVRALYESVLTDLENSMRIESADSGDAATKAGATFARRNRERIKAMKALLDEMTAEFPTEDSIPPDDPATLAAATGDPNTQALPVKSILDLSDTEIYRLVEDRIEEALKRK
jgi:hypothetical protein